MNGSLAIISEMLVLSICPTIHKNISAGATTSHLRERSHVTAGVPSASAIGFLPFDRFI